MLEIGNALAKARYRKAAVELLEAIENDNAVEIVGLSEALWDRAYRLFRDRTDKEWGMIDCCLTNIRDLRCPPSDVEVRRATERASKCSP